MQGHRVAHSKYGEINVRPYVYFRYLNQLGYDKSYVDGFGKTQTVDRRQDIQLNKVSIYFSGWAFDPEIDLFSICLDMQFLPGARSPGSCCR